MSNSILPSTLAPALPNSVQSRNSGQSHQGWLKELEHAQAQLLGQESKQGHAARSSSTSSSSTDVSAMHTDNSSSMLVDARSNQQTIAVENQPFMRTSAVETAPFMSKISLAVSTLPAGGVSASTLPMDDRIFVSEDVPETDDSLPGRERPELSKTSFKLVQSEQSLGAAVRDSSMTLESELKLGQHIKSIVRGTGARLGKIWLNGRAIVNDSLGDKHGN